jgi:hypothetical protein
MSKFLLLAIICAALTAGSASPVLAHDQSHDEYHGTATQQAACRPDVLRFCGPEIPNVRRITACLRWNIARLSQNCAAVFAEEQH